MPKCKNKIKKKSAGKKILNTPEQKAVEIKREIVGLLTLTPTPTLVADRKLSLVAIPKSYNFT